MGSNSSRGYQTVEGELVCIWCAVDKTEEVEAQGSHIVFDRSVDDVPAGGRCGWCGGLLAERQRYVQREQRR